MYFTPGLIVIVQCFKLHSTLSQVVSFGLGNAVVGDKQDIPEEKSLSTRTVDLEIEWGCLGASAQVSFKGQQRHCSCL